MKITPPRRFSPSFGVNRPGPSVARINSSFAFTLIELLITIGIIAILAALIFAMSQNARKSAAKVSTLSSMRQIGAAMQMYTGENSGRLPGPLTVSVFSWVDYPTENTVCSLGRYLIPYLGSYYHTPWLTPQTRMYVPTLNNPALPQTAQQSDVAQFVRLDYPPSSVDNIFGGLPAPAGLAFSLRGTITPEPKTVASLTDTAMRSAILTTADQTSLASAVSLLPVNGVMNGKRPYLFLDGSVEGPSAHTGIWAR